MVFKLILTIFCWFSVLPIVYGFNFGIYYNYSIISVYVLLLFLMFIFSIKQNKIIAVCETVLINVNLAIRKTEKYPTWAYNRLLKLKKTHQNGKFPSVLGKPIGLKK